MYQWKTVFNGTVDDRPVQTEIGEDGDLRVTTTQKGTVSTDGLVEPGTTIFPTVISDGDKIEIDAETPDELEKALVDDGGFSESDAKEIARHTRIPGSGSVY